MQQNIINSVFGGISGAMSRAVSMVLWVYKDDNTNVFVQLGFFWLGMFVTIMLAKYLYLGLIAVAVIGSISIWMRSRSSHPASDRVDHTPEGSGFRLDESGA